VDDLRRDDALVLPVRKLIIVKEKSERDYGSQDVVDWLRCVQRRADGWCEPRKPVEGSMFGNLVGLLFWCFGECADGLGDPGQQVCFWISVNIMACADAECVGNRESNLSGKSMRMIWRSISMIWGRISVFVVARDETMVCRNTSLSSSSRRCSGTSTTLML
jgi:hypothetical protein